MTSSNTTTTINAGFTREPAAKVILAGASGPDVLKLRLAWAKLMDTGELDEAHRLLSEINSSGTLEMAISAGLAELVMIERRMLENTAKAQQAIRQAEFEARLPKLAYHFFPRSHRAQMLFIKKALAVGVDGGDAILKGREAGEAWLNPPTPTPREGRTEVTRAKANQRLHRSRARVAQDRELVTKQRSGTGAR